MFLFLSKFLPLFLYPLGLSCLLLVIAIVLFWRRPRLVTWCLALTLTTLLVSSNYWVATELMRSLEWQNLPHGELPQAAAIIVLGGATQPAYTPRPWVEIEEAGDRILYAAKLYRQEKAPLVILSGGRISWRGRGTSESTDMATLVQTMGVPAQAILQDPTSVNTHENAINVKQILESRQINQPVLLVTSAMHMPRSLAIFKHLGIDAIAAPTDFQVTVGPQDQGFLGFLVNLPPSVENLQDTTQVLKEYLGLVTYRLRGWL